MILFVEIVFNALENPWNPYLIMIKQDNRIEKTKSRKKRTAEGFSEYGRLFIINWTTHDRNAILYNLQVLIRFTSFYVSLNFITEKASNKFNFM